MFDDLNQPQIPNQAPNPSILGATTEDEEARRRQEEYAAAIQELRPPNPLTGLGVAADWTGTQLPQNMDALQALRQSALTPEEQARAAERAKTINQLAQTLDYNRYHLSPAKAKLYGGKFDPATAQPGEEFEPTTGQKLKLGLKNFAFSLPSMLGLPILQPMVKTEAGATRKADKSFETQKQMLTQLFGEERTARQEQNLAVNSMLQLTNQQGRLGTTLNAQSAAAEDRKLKAMASLQQMAQRTATEKRGRNKDLYEAQYKLYRDSITDPVMKERLAAQESVNDRRSAIEELKQEGIESPTESEIRIRMDDYREHRANWKVSHSSPTSQYQLFQKEIEVPESDDDPRNPQGVRFVPKTVMVRVNKLTGESEYLTGEGTAGKIEDKDRVSKSGRLVIESSGNALSNVNAQYGAFMSMAADPRFKQTVGGIFGSPIMKMLRERFTGQAPAFSPGYDLLSTVAGMQHAKAQIGGRAALQIINRIVSQTGESHNTPRVMLLSIMANKTALELMIGVERGQLRSPTAQDMLLLEKEFKRVDKEMVAWQQGKRAAPPEAPNITYLLAKDPEQLTPAVRQEYRTQKRLREMRDAAEEEERKKKGGK